MSSFPDHCTMGVSHVAQHSLREKLRLLQPSIQSDLLPMQDPNLRPTTTTSLCEVPSQLYGNPSLLLDFPTPESSNPSNAFSSHPDWVMSYASANLYTSSNVALDQLPSSLLLHHPNPFPSNDSALVQSYTTDPKQIGCDATTQGLTLSLASAFPQEQRLGLLHELVPSAMGKGGASQCAVGPLGPFTGYATILQSSKYLRPAQLLLDECCTPATGVLHGKSPDPVAFRRDVPAHGGRGREGGVDCGRGSLQRAEIQERKAKLLVLQGEVCKRYKQYKQQIQMALSSFESVAGLGGAIPFMSTAVKTVSRHFRFLKNVITEQVIQISRALGEEISSSPNLDYSERASTSRSKFLEQTLRRQKAEESGLHVLENSQPIWRPQRGLPERAVAVLRAWLFDHFLHPYPTDTDKLMLAQQTGLTRNQVSNWFINARVRVWKPMVEEIHMLETKGSSEKDHVLKKDSSQCIKTTNQDPDQVQQDQRTACSFSHPCQSEPSFTQNVEHWSIEKRSRMEACSSGSNVAGQFAANLSAYHQGGIDMGGRGSVSLTLALRQDEGAWQQQYQQMRPYFGGQIINE